MERRELEGSDICSEGLMWQSICETTQSSNSRSVRAQMKANGQAWPGTQSGEHETVSDAA